MNGQTPPETINPAGTQSQDATPATDMGAEATPITLRSRFREAVAPVEAELDSLETAQHREAQAVETETTARKALDDAAAVRADRTSATTATKNDVRTALTGLGDFVSTLQAELDR